MPEKILAQAAEAVIILQENKVIKRRIAKGYRIQALDEKLRKLRTRSESKIMLKLQDKINIPKILQVNEKNKEITMEFIQGKKLSDTLESLDWKKIAQVLGQEIAKIHDLDIVHGDLTTSNMIYVENSEPKNSSQIRNFWAFRNEKLRAFLMLNKNYFSPQGKSQSSSLINPPNNQKSSIQNSSSFTNNKDNFKIFFIDFGLGFHSSRIEDKAVDLHLIKQALEAKHFTIFQEFFKVLLENYNSKDKTKTLEQLKKVESRGRYKH